MNDPTYLLLIALLSLFLAVFFGGLGSSFLTAERNKPDNKIKVAGLSSLIISAFISNPAVFITSSLFGYFLSLVCFTFSFAALTGQFLFVTFGIHSIVIIIVLQIFSILLVLVFTVFLLRLSIFRVKPEPAMKILALPALLFYLTTFLLSLLILAVTNIFSRYLLRINENIKREGFFYRFSLPGFYSPFNIEDSVNENSEDEEPEMKIFQNALEFSKLKVRDCMVPRNEIEGLEIQSDLNELREKFIESGYSKILVYEETIDNIIGYISSKELFKNPESIKSSLVSMSIVPESMQINKLLHNLIKERRSIALVVDEYGGTSGIVTLEDIMEEIFGEIEDEHDTQEFIERQVNENEFILSGRLEIDYLNEEYKLNIPETEDYDTLAGYIIYHYQNIPKLNTRVIIEDLHMRILKVSQTRIELVHVRRENQE